MAIDIKLTTDADLGAVDDLADGLEQVADAAENLERVDADGLERSLDKTADAADETADALEDAGKAADGLDDAADAAKDLGKNLGKAEDAAKDLDKNLERAGDSGKELDKVGEEAQAAAQQIDRDLIAALKDVADQAEKTGKKAKEVGKGFTDAADESETAMGGLKEEAGDSAREAAASFTGEFEDMGDFIQEVMANAFQSAGPLGMGAGLALAAAFGIGISKITESAERQAGVIERRFEDMADNMQDSLSLDFVDDEIKSIISDSEDALIDFAGAQEVAARTGLDLATVLRGYAGDADAAREVMEHLGPATSDSSDNMNVYRRSIMGSATATSDAQTKLEAYRETQKLAGPTVRGTTTAISGMVDAMREQQDAAEDARQASADLYEQAANLNDVYSETATAIAETTAAGGDQAQVLLDQKASVAGAASEYQGYLDTLAASGATSSEVQAEYDRLTGEIRRLGEQAGISDSDVDAMIDTIMAVPPTTEHKVSVSGDQRAKAQMRALAMQAAGIDKTINFRAQVITPAWQIANQAAALAAAARPVINVVAKVARVIG